MLCRKALAVVAAALIAGGSLAYANSNLCSRNLRQDNFDHLNGTDTEKEIAKQNEGNSFMSRKSRQKKSGLKSLKALAGILLAQMGRKGMQNLLSLAAIVVLKTALSNRLAKVQGFLFRAAFLRRMPLFLRLIAENLLLCLVQSAFLSTTKYVTGTLSLHFRKILTDRVHADYFQVPTLLDKQGAQFFAVALLVVSRTWISDRIASLNGNNLVHVFCPHSDAKPPVSNPLLLIEERRDLQKSEELSDEDVISFSEVDIVTPAQKLLARKLTFKVTPGRSLLVTGPNGSGKSSLFRVLGGLWPMASGKITKPGQLDESTLSLGVSRDVFYVPQQPYTALGTLRDQIIYPLTLSEATLKASQESGQGADGDCNAAEILDTQLRCILENVRLVYLLEREGGWDATANWEDMLSLGEQQRFGMARLFFHNPKFGILDECTNATSIDVEEQLYKLAQTLGITVVTISQRPALIPFHSTELRLIDGEGSWELRAIKP